MYKPETLLIIGPPGSGKGMQAGMLAQKGDYFHISIGDMYRSKIQGSYLEHQIICYRAQKKFDEADAIVHTIFREQIEQSIKERLYDPKTQSLVVDGLPRHPGQIPFIDETLSVDLVIQLYVPREISIARVNARSQNGNRSYDLDERITQNKLGTYYAHTKRAIEVYKERGIMKPVDGARTPEIVHEQILAALNDHRKL